MAFGKVLLRGQSSQGLVGADGVVQMLPGTEGGADDRQRQVPAASHPTPTPS